MNEAYEMGGILPDFTTCPCCQIEKRPQEERMALPGEYDRVFCLSCLRSSNQLSPQLTKCVADLPQSFANLVVSLSKSTFDETIELTFPGYTLDLPKISAPAVQYVIRQHLPKFKIPAPRLKALKELLAKGFVISHTDLDSCERRVMLSFFPNEEIEHSNAALKAEIKWNAC